MSVKSLIKKNLFFQVDFSSKYHKKKGEKIKQIVKFFLIGVLPIAIEYPDGKIERSVLKVAREVKKNQYLRLVHGVRFKKLKEAQKGIFDKFKVRVDYWDEAKEIAGKAEQALDKIIETNKFMDKDIKSVKIINIDSL